ncbi:MULTISPECIES: LysR substrate-binding domain-containing protein [unclassified Ruegeria]|uniref:LysR substrate-binding domain-containing protein n=1 Tax=unclassified Ruegeria TaxID=2625375 RepID=UPI001488B945|nr:MULTISPECIES: LysR substrate-binding domain-containing protein [unclassified Ruegeria]NOD76975.1 LysR family transcriptional regulator [Ruegeria sp. HKCCD4332]NOD88498.1 LysR family transcriptional regulator [Ruegeria sp. HKCCD4318]NOE13407.1 LysR family transcriptional regulator [Ruegeria sp. HKCCD4318-2]NOG11051.1 LysR family transcriptional regulator [Ruegeria sp. HKCCD4315]
MILNLPYSALRAFEAVVRHSGFSPAATELGVSQSAVSQHVRSLEEWLGRELLVRGARQSRPTREGELLALAISEGLGRISDVCAQLRDKTRSDRTIVISCLPGFAFNWLFPRLLRFDMAHPDLSISIATDTGQFPFSGADADIGIRYGLGDYPGYQVDLLMNEQLFPVCAPSLLPDLRNVEDLARHTMLVDENLHHGAASPTWEFWARRCGLTLPNALRTRRLGQSNMVVQAAIEGLGVALGREPLVIDMMSDDRLVRPFKEMTQSPLSYWLVRPHETKDSAKVSEFLTWIHSEVATQPEIPQSASF